MLDEKNMEREAFDETENWKDITGEEEDDALPENEEKWEEDDEEIWDPELLIRCDSLVKIYKSEDVEVMALQGLDLEIKKGELMAVIGKSGDRKSVV